MNDGLHIERGDHSARDVERATAALWADLAFDDAAKTALKRDGFMLDGLRLTGPSPFVVLEIPEKEDQLAISVEAANDSQREALLALWQVHFFKRLREAA